MTSTEELIGLRSWLRHDQGCPIATDDLAECECGLKEAIVEAATELTRLAGERDEARAALQRLGSMEAFAGARAIKIARNEELIARIDFARLTEGQRAADVSFQKWLANTRRDHAARREAQKHRTSDSNS